MFADQSALHTTILEANPETRGACRVNSVESALAYNQKLAHLATITRKGGYYAIPLPSQQQATPDSTAYMCFQLLGYRPGDKKYMQRLTNWSRDTWQGSLVCSLLGVISAEKHGDSDSVAMLTNDFSARFDSSSIQPVSVESLFEEDRVVHMHQLHNVVHTVGFDTSAIQDTVDVNSIPDELDHYVSFMKLVLCRQSAWCIFLLLKSNLMFMLMVCFCFQICCLYFVAAVVALGKLFATWELLVQKVDDP